MKNKKMLIAIITFLISLLLNLVRTNAFITIRTVDLLQLLACGILIGVLLTRIISRQKTK